MLQDEPAPRLIENVDELTSSVPGHRNYFKLIQRVVKRTKSTQPITPFGGSGYAPIGFRIFRYGPFSMCRMTYSRGECKIEECTGACGKCQLTGFGMAEKSHRDPEHPQAGKNIAFSRAATQLFNKYAVRSK